MIFFQKKMPRGRPAKSKRGHTTSEELDPKLPKRNRNLILKRLQNEKRKKFEEKELKEDIEENKRNKGRPSLRPEGPMNENEPKERRKDLNKIMRKEEAKEQKMSDKEEKRRQADNIRWNNEREKKKVHSLVKCRTEMRALRPDSLRFDLDLFSMVVEWRQECPILSTSPCLSSRSGKTQQYERLQQLKSCFSSCPYVNKTILTWATDLATKNYDLFVARGLSFRDPMDIPRVVVMRAAEARIRKEVWSNTKRKDVWGLKLDIAIQVCKVRVKLFIT